MPRLVALVAAAALGFAWLALRRANELCVVEIAGGRATLRRGRAPARFLSDVRDIAARAGTDRSVFAVVSEGGSPRVVLRSGRGGEVLLQQLRNVAGQHQVLHFRAGAAGRAAR